MNYILAILQKCSVYFTSLAWRTRWKNKVISELAGLFDISLHVVYYSKAHILTFHPLTPTTPIHLCASCGKFSFKPCPCTRVSNKHEVSLKQQLNIVMDN